MFSAGLSSIRMDPLLNRTSLWEVDSFLVLSWPPAALRTVVVLLGSVSVNEGSETCWLCFQQKKSSKDKPSVEIWGL